VPPIAARTGPQAEFLTARKLFEEEAPEVVQFMPESAERVPAAAREVPVAAARKAPEVPARKVPAPGALYGEPDTTAKGTRRPFPGEAGQLFGEEPSQARAEHIAHLAYTLEQLQQPRILSDEALVSLLHLQLEP
jgi:hypothetical protein